MSYVLDAAPPPTPVRRRSWYHRHEAAVLGTAAALVLLVAWEAAWQLKLISPMFFSGPSAVLAKLYELLVSGQLARDAAYTGGNFGLGLLLGAVCGIPAGIAIGWYRVLRYLFDPLISLLYATPRIALYPLIIIWFGIGSGSSVFIVFLSTVLPILINTAAGVRNVDADLLKVARAYCATDRQMFFTIALPASVPFIVTGLRQAIAHGLIGVVISELMVGNQGLGFMISYAGQTFATDQLLAGVVVIAVAGMVLSLLAERVQRRFQRWRANDGRG